MVAINGRALAKPSGGVRRFTEAMVERLDGRVVAPGLRNAFGLRGHAWEQGVLLSRTRAEPLLSPANTGPIAHPRHVVVLHDAAPFDVPETFAKTYARTSRALIHALHRSGATIATVSPFSAERLAHWTGSDPERYLIAPNGVDKGLTRLRSEKPTLVMVGGDLGPRKNGRTVAEAFKQVRAKIPEATLHVVGPPPAKDVWARSHAAWGSAVTFHTTLDDSNLQELVARAWCNVFVPKYEGFGLPAIEAQAAGTPSVLSGIAPLRSVAHPDDIIVDDYRNATDVADAVLEILGRPWSLEGSRELSAHALRTHRWAPAAEALRVALAQARNS